MDITIIYMAGFKMVAVLMVAPVFIAYIIYKLVAK